VKQITTLTIPTVSRSSLIKRCQVPRSGAISTLIDDVSRRNDGRSIRLGNLDKEKFVQERSADFVEGDRRDS
jgi:hypothetical protein